MGCDTVWLFLIASSFQVDWSMLLLPARDCWGFCWIDSYLPSSLCMFSRCRFAFFTTSSVWCRKGCPSAVPDPDSNESRSLVTKSRWNERVASPVVDSISSHYELRIRLDYQNTARRIIFHLCLQREATFDHECPGAASLLLENWFVDCSLLPLLPRIVSGPAVSMDAMVRTDRTVDSDVLPKLESPRNWRQKRVKRRAALPVC
jgi:hypothetical protein